MQILGFLPLPVFLLSVSWVPQLSMSMLYQPHPHPHPHYDAVWNHSDHTLLLVHCIRKYRFIEQISLKHWDMLKYQECKTQVSADSVTASNWQKWRRQLWGDRSGSLRGRNSQILQKTAMFCHYVFSRWGECVGGRTSDSQLWLSHGSHASHSCDKSLLIVILRFKCTNR